MLHQRRPHYRAVSTSFRTNTSRSKCVAWPPSERWASAFTRSSSHQVAPLHLGFVAKSSRLPSLHSPQIKHQTVAVNTAELVGASPPTSHRPACRQWINIPALCLGDRCACQYFRARPRAVYCPTLRPKRLPCSQVCTQSNAAPSPATVAW